MTNKKRLIDASAVLETQFTTGLSDTSGNYYGYADVVFASDIENAPTVDAVEVVRCKDCVYWENGKDYTPFCNRPEYGFHECPKPDDFCSYGERRQSSE